MTTIAITATQVAADGQRTYGGERRGMNFKKLRVCKGVIYAFTGLTPLMEPMIAWHQSGADPEKLPVCHNADSDGWALIVIDGAGIGKYTSSCPYREDFEPPVAFGADRDLAMGAMLVGASAEEAIRAACSISLYTGGEVQTIQIEAGMWAPTTLAAE